MPKTETAKCEHKRWLLTGTKQTCRSCGLTKPQPGRGIFEVAAEHRQKVTNYLKAQPGGKRGEWDEFAKAVGVTGTQLGVIVTSMLEDGLISEPDGKGSMVYTIISAKGRATAKKLYAEQHQEVPKAVLPANVTSLEDKLAASIEAKKAQAAA